MNAHHSFNCEECFLSKKEDSDSAYTSQEIDGIISTKSYDFITFFSCVCIGRCFIVSVGRRALVCLCVGAYLCLFVQVCACMCKRVCVRSLCVDAFECKIILYYVIQIVNTHLHLNTLSLPNGRRGKLRKRVNRTRVLWA